MKEREILIIENNAKNMNFFCTMLQLNNYKVLRAKDAESGFEILKVYEPDLILLSMQLPGMDGYMATRLIKKDPRLKPIPVVGLTTDAMDGDIRKILEAGCDGYISRPIETHSFLKEIESYLDPKQRRPLASQKKSKGHAHKILVVGKNRKNLKQFEKLMPGDEFEIITARNDEECLEKVYDELPDVILLDVKLSNKEGLRAAVELKADLLMRDIPIILVTNLDGMRSGTEKYESFAEEFLKKPVTKVELLARIRSMLQLKQYRDQLVLRKKTEDFFAKEIFNDVTNTLGLSKLPNVLLVEDDSEDIQKIMKILGREPISLNVVTSGEEAVSSIQSSPVDLILLDILLPDMTVFEVCSRLKSMDVAKDIPVIVLTSLDELHSNPCGTSFGVDDFLIKPINAQELKARIRVILEKKGQLDKLRTHYEKALNSVIIDPLTGLYNYSYLKEFLRLEIKRAERRSYPVSLLLMGIDDFGSHLKTRGRASCDDMVRTLAHLIKGSIREVDLTARYDRDEFAAVLPYSSKELAVKVAERIQKRISSADTKPGYRREIEDVTLSVGIVDYPSNSIGEDNIIQYAAETLARAREQGKNQISFFEDEGDPAVHTLSDDSLK